MMWVRIVPELLVFGAGLVASGLFAALAVRAAEAGQDGRKRPLRAATMGLGVVFLVIRGAEYAGKSAQGINRESHAFFTFSYLLTGFNAAHVLAAKRSSLRCLWENLRAPRRSSDPR